MRVTPDATVEHVRKRHDPDNVFTVPMVPELPTEGSLFEIMRRMRLDEKKMELNRKHHGGSAGAKSVYMSGTRGGLGSNGDPTSAGSADGSPAGEFSTETYDGIAQENDASVGQSPLHIAARRNSVRDIKLWIEAYSKNTLDNRDFTPLMVAASHNSVRAMVFLLRMGGVRKDDVDCKMQRTALHWAVFHGHAAAALTLLRYGADARFRDREGRTPVHLAAMHPRPACLRRILQFVNPSALLEGDNEQMTPLHLAVMSDNVRHLQIMLRVQPPIDITAGDVEGKTALHWCTQNTEPQSYAPTLFHKPVTCSKLLIESQPRLVGLTDLEGRTPLHLACSNANRPLIVEMCGQMIGTQVLKSIVNTQDIQGRTATHYAAISGHPYILRVLRHYGASEGLADRDGATALHYACAKNHGQCVSILISENRLYESYVRDNLGRTPVMWAAMKGCTEALRILLEAGVNPNEYDEKGATGIATGGHSHCVLLLLEHGAAVDACNAEMHTALFLAVQYGHGETVNILIQHGANVKQLDPDDRSPLHWAALCGHLSVVSLLISCEVEIDARDAEGKTPVHCAAYNGHTEVLSFLVKNGAKANIKDNEGVSALHWATCGNHDDCVELLIQLNASPNILDNDLLTPLDYAISVRSHECASVLVERGGQPGEIICDVFAFRIQRAWRRHQRRRHARKASSGGDARQGRRGSLMPRASFSGMQQGRRVSIGGMGAFAMPAAHAGGARRASMAVAGAGRSSRDYSMRGMDMTDTGTGGLTLDSSKSTRSSRSRSLFPSRPSLVKSSASRSRMQLSVQPRHDASITEDDGRFDMRKRLSNVQSMSSFEMEYFQMEAERRRKEEEGR